ncbi:MAG: hypothetical protein ONB23_01930 [candidate division KSB1 bacterium]|nr:hypothetical protein [candidate division KSB1 bacterium]
MEGQIFDTRDFLILEQLPPSSNALRQKISAILLRSQRWRAVVEEVDPQDGTFRIVLEGQLRRTHA